MGQRIEFTPNGTKLKHGTTNAYGNYGCRCDECRAANTAATMRLARRRGVRPVEEVRRERFEAVQHGTQWKYYKHGCRCDACREGERVRRNVERAKARAKPTPERVHGTINGYTNYACRCDGCRDAHRMWQRRRRGLDTVTSGT